MEGMGGMVPGEATAPAEPPAEVMPGMGVPSIARHAAMMTIMCMSILLFAFGSGMSRSRWHHWAGGVAVAYGLLAACFTPAHEDHKDSISTFTGSQLHRWMGSIIITLIFSQGLTGVLMTLNRRKAEKEDPTGFRGVPAETPRETQALPSTRGAEGGSSTSPSTLSHFMSVVYPLRLVIAAIHGWCGLWLPLFGFAQIFIAMDMMWGMCQHHGYPMQCTAHIGLSCLSSILGFIAMGTALYPHSRVIVVAWRNTEHTSPSAVPHVLEEEEERTGLLGDTHLHSTGSGSATPARRDTAPTVWLGPLSQEEGDPMLTAVREDDVMHATVEVLHHHSNTFLPPAGTANWNTVLATCVAFPVGTLVCVGHALSALYQHEPPDHSEAQHTGMGALGVAMFFAELVFRYGPPSLRSAAGGRLWWIPRAVFFIGVGSAMGLHHQHSATMVAFHTQAGLQLASAGVLLLVEVVAGALMALPEVELATAAVRERPGREPVALLGTSTAAARYIALLRCLRLAQGFLIMLSGVIFVGSSPSSQAMAPLLVPNAWGVGSYYIYAVIVVGWFMVVAAICQAGAVPPQWRTLQGLVHDLPRTGGLRAAFSHGCCCSRPSDVSCCRVASHAS